MKIISKTTLVAVFLSLTTLPAMAGGTSPIEVGYVMSNLPDIHRKAPEDKALTLRYEDFERFAKSKVEQMNLNHRFSRPRMEIVRQPDGSYRARYHQIDDSTWSVKVQRSESGSIPYVGILTYRDQVFESSASAPEQLDQALFAVVEVIPNRHIFSYQKGAWK
jgi:hypothetical protein